MPHRHSAVAFLGVALVALCAFNAQAQGPRPVERLSFFEGTWTREDAPANVTARETCAWLAGGRRHMVCEAEAKLARGPVGQLKVFSYRNSAYVATVFTGDGPSWTYSGGPDGDRWVFSLQSERPDNPQRLRIIVTPTKDRIRFVEESSEDNGPWKTTEDYTHVRVK